MSFTEKLWTPEFLQKTFDEKQQFREWAVKTAVALYPDLGDEMLLQLFKSNKPSDLKSAEYISSKCRIPQNPRNKN